MTITKTNILTNGQAAQEHGAGQTPCSEDMETKRIPDESWYDAYEDKKSDLFIYVLAGAYKFRRCFRDVLHTLTPAEAVSGLQEVTADIFREQNKERPEEQQVDPPAGLTPLQLAHLAMYLRDVVVMSPQGTPWASRSVCEVYAYQSDGPYEGLYAADLFPVFLEFEPDCPLHKMQKALRWLRGCAERGKRCSRKTLVPVDNGIFNCRTKKLMPFSPKYVFLSKYCWAYVESGDGPVMRDDTGLEEPIDVWVKTL